MFEVFNRLWLREPVRCWATVAALLVAAGALLDGSSVLVAIAPFVLIIGGAEVVRARVEPVEPAIELGHRTAAPANTHTNLGDD